MTNREETSLNALLKQGIAACQAGDLANARQALIAALKIDPQSELGWLWLSSALTEPAERRACLQRVLSIHPNHPAALNGLKWLDEQYPPAQPVAPAPPPAAPSAPPPSPWSAAPAEPAAEPTDELEDSYATPAFGHDWRRAEAAPPPAAQPDWLDEALQQAEAAPSPASAPAVSPWSAAPAEPPAAPPSPVEAAQPIADDTRPDWLAAALTRAAPTVPLKPLEETEEVEAVESEGPPDWLAAALGQPETLPPLPAAPPPIEPHRPDWLEAALGHAEPAGPFSDPAAVPAIEEEEDVPDWLAEVNRQSAGGHAEALAPEATETQPNWLIGGDPEPLGGEATLAETLALGDQTWPETPTLSAAPMRPLAPARAGERSRPEATACPWCSSPISGLDLACPTCHRPLEFECPDCDYSVPLDVTQCPNCGRVTGEFRDREVYLRNLGEDYLAKGMNQRALPVYLNLIETAPDNTHYSLRAMKVYADLGQTEKSVPLAERVLELDPQNADALDRLGRWYAVQGDFDRVAHIVDRLNQIKERSPRLTLLLGDLEFERRQYPAAFRAYREAAAHADFDKPTLARLNFRLGEMYLVAEDMLEALHAFQACAASGADIHEVTLARQRIEQIRPPLPPSATRSASETLRAMAGPLLLVWLTGAVQAGLRFQNMTAALVVGLFAAVPGSYLVASAVSTPTAIEWRSLLGEKGLTQPLYGAIVAILGGLILLTSVVLIVFGF